MHSAFTIPGLQTTPEIETELARMFGAWAAHFRDRLQSEGMPYLLSEYRITVESLETKSCGHGPHGTRLTGEAWQWCCGVSYELSNDLASRDAIERILALLSSDTEQELRARVAELDARLYVLYEHKPPRVAGWWHQGLPRGVKP